MAKEYSPFRPGAIVPLDLFVGRKNEVRKIVSTVKKSIGAKTVERIFVEGGRGLGKSSLCAYATAAIEKDSRALVLSANLGGVHTLKDFVRSVFTSMVQIQGSSKWYDPLRNIFKDWIEEVDLFGVTVKLKLGNEDVENLMYSFPETLSGLLKKFKEHERPEGLVFIFDDINGLASHRDFAEWFKSVIDKMSSMSQDKGSLPVTFIFVGIPERKRELIQGQPSLDRVFDVISINSLRHEDVRIFYEEAFRSVGVAVEEDAFGLLTTFSQGYPVFLHEIGDAVFNVDEDSVISKEDTALGILEATQIIGKKYIATNVFKEISSGRYMEILKKLQPYWKKFPEDTHRIVRANILTVLHEREKKVLGNFFKKMCELDVVRREGGSRSGTYVFPNILYATYFGMFMEE